MLATVPTLRRPALRRSDDVNALFATDLPLLADAADFCRLAEKHGWRTWMQGGWLLLDKLPNPRTHNPLPGRLLPYLCRTAEERTGNP